MRILRASFASTIYRQPRPCLDTARLSSPHSDGWQMIRDANDEWLDTVLIEREPQKVFACARHVVETFLVNESSDDRPPLAKDENTARHWTDILFEPLYCTSSGRASENSSLPPEYEMDPPIKRVKTSKKNRRRVNLKIVVSYRGGDYCGWEDQRHELYQKDPTDASMPIHRKVDDRPPSVQGTLADILGPILEPDARHETRPIRLCVAGRTDLGVSAIRQVCRARTWRNLDDIETYVRDRVNKEAQERGLGLRIQDVESVDHSFHPTFDAQSRAYAYLIDTCSSGITLDVVVKLNQLLEPLVGKELDYFVLSYGKVKTQTTTCTMHRARATIVEWKEGPSLERREAICIELLGDRFLRRMVRLLVGTALREAHRGDGGAQSLIDILQSNDRRRRSRAAPPGGLIFVGAMYTDGRADG
ncbi:hypothetical protein THAOC_05423 [Thalassiosira oceanica]|uniref:tRNA pseudouridine synthase n=1 Tax=Thalassiosira oceanica TaxID=159749 RepID=K0TH32_THAOC|nr:hypothetical protein THAOC_05423 [Thalassiosira oceanica]|eukprot:EJK72986.1 hypothetical protein THAOC_05423 [Thalassiosira oceanica]